MKISKASEAGPKIADSGVVAGPPGSGKSTLLGSMAEVEAASPILVVATLPREIKSWKYQQHNVDYILINDDDWMPTLGHFNAIGFKKFLELMVELRDDTHYRSIVIDSGTELGEMGWHYAMAVHNVASPAEMEDKRSRWLPYEQLDIHLDQAVKSAVALTMPGIAKLPKNVWFSWHSQAAKEDSMDPNKQTADKLAKTKEYEGKTLPMIRGRFRKRLMSLVSTFIWTHKTFTGDALNKQVNYQLQVVSDFERSCKVPGPVPDFRFLESNLWKDFLPFLEAQKVLEQAPKPKGKNAKKKSAKKAALSL